MFESMCVADVLSAFGERAYVVRVHVHVRACACVRVRVGERR